MLARDAAERHHLEFAVARVLRSLLRSGRTSVSADAVQEILPRLHRRDKRHHAPESQARGSHAGRLGRRYRFRHRHGYLRGRSRLSHLCSWYGRGPKLPDGEIQPPSGAADRASHCQRKRNIPKGDPAVQKMYPADGAIFPAYWCHYDAMQAG